MRVNTLSKLTFLDAVRFDDLVRDIFPGTALSNIQNPALLAALHEAYADEGLVFSDKQAQKALELSELLRQRMGVVIVGYEQLWAPLTQ